MNRIPANVSSFSSQYPPSAFGNFFRESTIIPVLENELKADG